MQFQIADLGRKLAAADQLGEELTVKLKEADKRTLETIGEAARAAHVWPLSI